MANYMVPATMRVWFGPFIEPEASISWQVRLVDFRTSQNILFGFQLQIGKYPQILYSENRISVNYTLANKLTKETKKVPFSLSLCFRFSINVDSKQGENCIRTLTECWISRYCYKRYSFTINLNKKNIFRSVCSILLLDLTRAKESSNYWNNALGQSFEQQLLHWVSLKEPPFPHDNKESKSKGEGLAQTSQWYLVYFIQEKDLSHMTLISLGKFRIWFLLINESQTRLFINL